MQAFALVQSNQHVRIKEKDHMHHFDWSLGNFICFLTYKNCILRATYGGSTVYITCINC